MPVHVLGKNNPPCPLCLKPFQKAETHNVVYYYCQKDHIQIMANDIMLDRQTSIDPETGEAIACSNGHCREKMRVFIRSDGFMKAVCPNRRCGAEVSTEAIPDGHLDVEKGKGTEGVNITRSDARRRIK